MSSFVLISDTHSKHAQLVVPNGDFLLHSGDFSMMGRVPETISFLKWFESQPHKHKVFTAGNHDWIAQREPDLLNALIKEHSPSCHYLNEETIILDGHTIFGSPWNAYFYNWAFNAHRGEEIMAHWNKIPTECEILLTHGPCYGILDEVEKNGGELSHVGDEDLVKTIKTRLKKLKLHLGGHLHLKGNQLFEQDGVIYVNGAVVGEDYKVRGEIQVVNL